MSNEVAATLYVHEEVSPYWPYKRATTFQEYFEKEGSLPDGKVPIQATKISEGKIVATLACWMPQQVRRHWTLEIVLPEEVKDASQS